MPNKKCDHGHEKSKCQECGGGSICEHSILRSTCSSCEPSNSFRRYQRKASERGLPFLLTEDQFTQIVAQRCAYCGEWGQPRGVDRVCNFQGYVPGNCIPCCKICNRFKSNLSKEHFLGHVRKISEYQEKLRASARAEPVL